MSSFIGRLWSVGQVEQTADPRRRVNTYNEKLGAAKSLVKKYWLGNCGDDTPPDIAEDVSEGASGEFIANIRTLGAVTEEGLSVLSHEDIIEALSHRDIDPNVVVFDGVSGKKYTPEEHLCLERRLQGLRLKPKVLAKQIADIFRGGGSDGSSRYISTRRAESMSFAELISVYDPLEADNSVGARLKSLSKGQPFVTFTSTGEVNIADSVFLLDELRQGYAPRTSYNGAKVCKVGEVDHVRMVDENPLFPGKPLRLDGTCDITNRTWDGIDLKTRQLASLISFTDEQARKNGLTADKVIDIIEHADKPFEKLGKRFPEALTKYNRLEREGKLPTLKVSLQPLSKPTNLFQGKKVS